ncbi:Zf-CCHC domain containing protein [Elysia marginata]|uniref:Zf-CCHC domain containing protein n=1 Tax=Elysia marginata TaxID=1093978 RepID=A0AAV4JBW5_9GAST|nr:Zf-CCHC domain containing protein [Elysia marginata]
MATANVKISEMLKAFNGEGGVGAWIRNVELVARLTKVTDLASFLPLYLEGNALAVYLEMGDKEKSDATVIKQKLIEAFTDSRFVAFSKLRSCKWTGKPVDVFANEIRRMARESGLTGDGLEKVVKLTFDTGFPDHISLGLNRYRALSS